MELLEFHKRIAFGETTELLELNTSHDPYFFLLNAIILRNLGKSEKALNYIETNINENTLLSPSRLLAFFSIKASINVNLGKMDLAQQQLKKCENYCDEKTEYSPYSNLWLSDYYLSYGMLTYIIGDSKKSLEYYDIALSLTLVQELDNIYKAKVKNNISIVYSGQGKFQQALLLLHENLSIWEELKFDFAIAQTLGNIGEIYRAQGNYGLALEQFHRILEIFTDHGRNIEILNCLKNIGSLQYLMGDAKSAKETFAEGKNYLIQDMTQYHKANFYFNHLEVEILGGDLDAAKQVLDDFQLFSGSSEDYYVKLRYTLSKAIYLAQSNNYWEKISALFEFDKLLKTESEDFETQSRSLIYLTELLFYQYKGFQDDHILEDVARNIEQLEKIAKKEKAHKFHVQAMMLKSHLYIFQNNSEQAKSTLLEAITICKARGFFNLSIQISDRFDQYFSESKHEDENPDTISDLLEIGVSKLDSKATCESDKGVCFFLLPELHNLNSQYQILRVFDDLPDIKSSVLDLIINKVSSLISQHTPKKIYRYTYRDHKMMLLLDRQQIVGYLYSGSSFFAQMKLEAFSEVFSVYANGIPGIIEDLNKSDHSVTIMGKKMDVTTFVDYIYLNQSREILGIEHESLLRSILPANMEILSTVEKYEALLHPIRNTIMKIMVSNFKLARADLEKIIGDKGGTFVAHLEKLSTEKFLSNSTELINNETRRYVMITQLGLQAYQEFEQSLNF